MKKRVIILVVLLLILVIILLLRFYKIDFLHGGVYIEKRVFHNSNYSEERIENSNLVIIMSNQSFEKEKVEIEGFVDSELLFKDDFKVGDQHLVSYYYRDLLVGEHILEVESEDGAKLSEVIEIGEDKLWVYITYWMYNSEPILRINKQKNAMGFD